MLHSTATPVCLSGFKEAPVMFSVKITLVELNVALYCANGYNSKQIARKLNRSPRTIESTKRRIHLKLKARNDAQMISELFRRKLIS
jgi:DNA-binding CsgD family transcriptional regulator